MIDYRAGNWGLSVAFGWRGSLAPRSLCMAVPNAIITFIIATWLKEYDDDWVIHKDWVGELENTTDAAQKFMATFSAVMLFILYNRSRTSYNRWWEGGTLLQKTRGEWFNAFSSIMAFTSTKPELQAQVASYTHLLARLMSLLMCCGLQQVSPHRDRPFEIINLDGIEPASMEFLNSAPDKVEILLQWIQRSMVLHMQTGVLPTAPPILSRAFQEVSRGIVNLQNARKIADFPYPYPLAQVSMILQIIHWTLTPFAASLAVPRAWAVFMSFSSIFTLWCIHFNALDLEFPFGTRVNDLPMHEMQQEWNKSVCTLLCKRAQRPPVFTYEPEVHDDLEMAMSDASALYAPTVTMSRIRQKARGSVSTIQISATKSNKASVYNTSSTETAAGAAGSTQATATPPTEVGATWTTPPASASTTPSAPGSSGAPGSATPAAAPSGADVPPAAPSARADIDTLVQSAIQAQPSTIVARVSNVSHGAPTASGQKRESGPGGTEPLATAAANNSGGVAGPASSSRSDQGGLSSQSRSAASPRTDIQEKLDEKAQIAWERNFADVCTRMQELHSCLIDEERRLMTSLLRSAAAPTAVAI